jgi:hypothetical protein
MHYICATVASSFILRRCAPVTLLLTSTVIVWKSVPHGCGRDNPKYLSPAVLEFAPRGCRRNPFWAQKHCLGFKEMCQNIVLKLRNLVRTFVEECSSIPGSYLCDALQECGAAAVACLSTPLALLSEPLFFPWLMDSDAFFVIICMYYVPVISEMLK